MNSDQGENPGNRTLSWNAAHRAEAHPGASTWLDLAIIFALALAVRLAWAIIAPSVDPFLVQSPLLGDAASYDRIARSLLAGTGFTERPPEPSAFWPPLYPAFLALVYSAGGYSLMAARIIQAFLGAVVPASFFLVASGPFGRRVAWMTALGLTFYPLLLVFGAWLIAESLFLALMSLGMLAVSNARQGWSLARAAAAGAVFGLAALAKPFMLFVTPFLAVWLFLALPQGILRRIVTISTLAMAMLAVVLPWTVRNYDLYGQVVLISTNGGYTFLGANNEEAWGGHDEGFPPAIPGLNAAEMEDAYYAEALHWIRNNPGDFVQLVLVKYARLFSPLSVASFRQDLAIPGRTFVYAAYIAFLLAAFYGAVRVCPRWRRVGHLYAPLAGVLISAGLFYGDARYTLPMVPSLVVFAAYSVESVWRRWAR